VEIVFAVINLIVVFGVSIDFGVVKVRLGNVKTLNGTFEALIYHGNLIFLVEIVTVLANGDLIVELGVVYNNVGVVDVVFVVTDLLVALGILIDRGVEVVVWTSSCIL